MTLSRCRFLHVMQLVQRLPELSVRPGEVAGTVLVSPLRSFPLHHSYGHLSTLPRLCFPA